MEKVPPPLPVVRWKPLLRGPLILTAAGRVLMIPFFLFCAVAASNDLKVFYHRLQHYRSWYIADKVAMAASMWAFLLLNLLLTWLFFARRQMFRPLMIYFSFLPPVYFLGVTWHLSHFQQRQQTHASPRPYMAWISLGVLLAMVIWPMYYGFSPRVKKVFTS